MSHTAIEIVNNEQLTTEDKISQLEALMFVEENINVINISDEFGNTALHFAAGSNEPELVNKILALGGDAHVENKQGETPLISAAASRKEHTSKIIMLLCEKGADVNHESQSGTPLILAVEPDTGFTEEENMRRVDIVKALIKYSKNLDVNKAKTTILTATIKMGNGSHLAISVELKNIKYLEKNIDSIIKDSENNKHSDDIIATLKALDQPVSFELVRDYDTPAITVNLKNMENFDSSSERIKAMIASKTVDELTRNIVSIRFALTFVERESVAQILELIKLNADPSCKKKALGETPIHTLLTKQSRVLLNHGNSTAISRSNVAVLDILFKNGAKVASSDIQILFSISIFATDNQYILSLISILNEIKPLEERLIVLQQVLDEAEYYDPTCCYNAACLELFISELRSTILSCVDMLKVRLASRMVFQGYRDENSSFFKLPAEIGTKIASHVAGIIDEEQAKQVAIENFERPCVI